MSTVEVSARAPLVGHSPQRLRLARRARLLAWTSPAWLCPEGTVAVVQAERVLAGSGHALRLGQTLYAPAA